ncbi:MAG: hypothetical protein APU95_00990 [Hadesarchaea archaeon YNP_N21]|nr:MAG: hypothetical protein APU95_00990 [Hadesarchaea archaeon YNP_N21]
MAVFLNVKIADLKFRIGKQLFTASAILFGAPWGSGQAKPRKILPAFGAGDGGRKDPAEFESARGYHKIEVGISFSSF